MGQVRVRVETLSKRYLKGESVAPYGRLTESLWEGLRSPISLFQKERREERSFWALRNVSLEVHDGEVLGIIGPNGAGKTTLLKILSRITEPTEGTATIQGRVASLLEVGTGFHPELTGRENVFLNGALLGMRRAEIARKFDEIVHFAGVEQFLDTPVKRYSSGMHVRLAFSVAAHLEPEILIVDEVLSVGDAAFQAKCLGKIGDVAHAGRTVLFVSHNVAAVERLCARTVLLSEGRKVFEGPSSRSVMKYLEQQDSTRDLKLAELPRKGGDGKLRILEVNSDLVCGKPGSISLKYESKSSLKNVGISVGIFTLKGEGVAYIANDLISGPFSLIPKEGQFCCKFNKVPFLPGTYTLHVYCTVNGVVADWITGGGRLRVLEGDFYGSGRLPPTGYGAVAVWHQWEIKDSYPPSPYSFPAGP